MILLKNTSSAVIYLKPGVMFLGGFQEAQAKESFLRRSLKALQLFSWAVLPCWRVSDWKVHLLSSSNPVV